MTIATDIRIDAFFVLGYEAFFDHDRFSNSPAPQCPWGDVGGVGGASMALGGMALVVKRRGLDASSLARGLLVMGRTGGVVGGDCGTPLRAPRRRGGPGPGPGPGLRASG